MSPESHIQQQRCVHLSHIAFREHTVLVTTVGTFCFQPYIPLLHFLGGIKQRQHRQRNAVGRKTRYQSVDKMFWDWNKWNIQVCHFATTHYLLKGQRYHKVLIKEWCVPGDIIIYASYQPQQTASRAIVCICQNKNRPNWIGGMQKVPPGGLEPVCDAHQRDYQTGMSARQDARLVEGAAATRRRYPTSH